MSRTKSINCSIRTLGFRIRTGDDSYAFAESHYTRAKHGKLEPLLEELRGSCTAPRTVRASISSGNSRPVLRSIRQGVDHDLELTFF